MEGIGEDFWPDAYDREIADQVVMVSDRDSFLTARRVTREEGILVGGSAGTAIWAALQVGHEAGHDAVIVVIIPDSGRGYLSKLYDDSWMADHGFLRSGGSAADTVSELLAHKHRNGTPSLPPLVHVHPDETVREAIIDPPRVRRLPGAGGQGRATAGPGRGGGHRDRTRPPRPARQHTRIL